MEETRKELKLDIELLGLEPGEKIPKMAMYLLNATGTVEKKVACVVEGKLALDTALAREEHKILALGPDLDDVKQISRDALLQFRIMEQWTVWERMKAIEIPKDWWIDWLWFKTCVSGRVRKCFPRIWDPWPRPHLGGIAPKLLPPLFSRCTPICNGVVEVYERECCCTPWIIPDISDILRKLKELIRRWPPELKVWPPPPPPPDRIGPLPEPDPDPLPLDRVALRSLKRNEAFETKTLTFEPPSHLSEDIKALETLPQVEAIKYVQERPHLWHFWCICSARKLGEAVLGPDGHFTFCYTRFPRLFRKHCKTTYFYKVKQWQENQWVYIYDGSTAHEYFTASQFADLRTWRGRACVGDGPEVPYERPFVMLQDVGSTHSWRLVSHWQGKNVAGNDLTQTGENSVAAPLPANGGLVNPPGAGGATLMQLVNQPWGEVLYYRLFFHPGMKPLGAHYYRISLVEAGSDGNPAPGATPVYLTHPLSWLKFVFAGGKVQVQGESLGPADPGAVGGNAGLYKIPYREDALWLEGQYHQYWDTRTQSNGKYLVALEIFDATGKRLTPGVASGTDVHKDFDYLRWLEETGPDSVSRVPFAKLVHLFWVDNLPVYSDIVDLRKNGAPSGDECQFMSGPASTTFSVGFRAFHSTLNSGTPPETFMYYYTMWWHRGLNGPNGTIETGGANKPSSSLGDPPAESTTQTFAQMLGTSAVGAKCTFAVNLWVYAKHTNGSRRLNEYDRFDQAAFALEITQALAIAAALPIAT